METCAWIVSLFQYQNVSFSSNSKLRSPGSVGLISEFCRAAVGKRWGSYASSIVILPSSCSSHPAYSPRSLCLLQDGERGRQREVTSLVCIAIWAWCCLWLFPLWFFGCLLVQPCRGKWDRGHRGDGGNGAYIVQHLCLEHQSPHHLLFSALELQRKQKKAPFKTSWHIHYFIFNAYN